MEGQKQKAIHKNEGESREKSQGTCEKIEKRKKRKILENLKSLVKILVFQPIVLLKIKS